MRWALCFLLLGGTMMKATGQEPWIVAHRGASKDAPENSIPAFELAWAQGADFIEGDFYQTADGHVVCMHDENTKRTTGQSMDIASSTLADLRQLDIGQGFGGRYAGAVIPTLPEVLATVPDGKGIFIEVKGGSEMVPTLLTDIAHSGLSSGQIYIISFDQKVIHEVKRAAPHLRAFWIVSFKIPSGSKSITPSFDQVWSTLEAIGADGVDAKNIDQDDRFRQRILATGTEAEWDALVAEMESFIRRIQGAGMDYHVWTVDDPDMARLLKKRGVRSITTNRPGFIRAALAEQ